MQDFNLSLTRLTQALGRPVRKAATLAAVAAVVLAPASAVLAAPVSASVNHTLASVNNTWAGATVDTNWNNPNNWSFGTVPTSTDIVAISAATRYPVLTGPGACASLTLNAGTSLTLATNAGPATVLSVGGDVLLQSGTTLTQQAGTTLELTGTLTDNGATFALNAASTVAFKPFFNNTKFVNGSAATATPFQNVTVGVNGGTATLQINRAMSVQRVLTLANTSTLTVAAGSSLRLLSNATATAQTVADAASRITGSVIVERYINQTGNTGTGYRHYSAPVTGLTVANLATAGFSPVLTQSYNTSPTPSLTNPFPNVFDYDESRVGTVTSNYGLFDQGFHVPVAAAGLTSGKGFAVNIPASEKMVFTGPVLNGGFTASGLTRGAATESGWQLLGNPVPSVLDMNTVLTSSTGMIQSVYVYQSSGPYTGSYQSFVNGAGVARYVESCQGYFMRVASSATTGVVNVPDAARVANAPTVAFQRTATETRPYVELALTSAATGQRDAAIAYFQTGATNGFDSAFDAYKLPSGNFPYVAFATQPEALSISGLPLMGAADVVLPLTVGVPATGTYTFSAAQVLNLPVGKGAYLRDAQTGALVDLATAPAYAFTMNAAFTGPRFSLVLTSNRALAAAPASLTNQVAVYPSPAHGQALVEVPASLRAQALSLTLVNALGQTVRTLALPATASAEARALSLEGVAPGVYSVCLATAQGRVSKRLVVE